MEYNDQTTPTRFTMTDWQLQMVSSELRYLGFSTQITNTAVIVALNRALYVSEVREALGQVFDEIQFSVEQWYGKVKVS